MDEKNNLAARVKELERQVRLHMAYIEKLTGVIESHELALKSLGVPMNDPKNPRRVN